MITELIGNSGAVRLCRYSDAEHSANHPHVSDGDTETAQRAVITKGSNRKLNKHRIVD